VKVAVLHSDFAGWSGAHALVYEYAKRNKDATVFTWYYDEKDPRFSQINVVKLRNRILESKIPYRSALASFFPKFLTLPDLRGYDVLLVSTSRSAEYSILNLRSKIPVGMYVHTPRRVALRGERLPPYPTLRGRLASGLSRFIGLVYLSALERRVWKRLDFAIFNSRLTLGRALRAGLIGEEKSKVIYPGVDLSAFSALRRSDDGYFLYVARFAYLKRQLLLIKAFREFSRRRPGFRLILAGSVTDPKYFRLVEREKGGGVEVLPNYKEIADLYARSAAFVHVPYMEDFGIAPLEAAAAGKYVINVRPSGNYEILRDFPGVDWIDEKFREEAMAKEIERTLEKFAVNRERCVELGRSNADLLRKLDLSWDRFTMEVNSYLASQVESWSSKG
jgi:glycosyltransferase involved in cell wall biosynthesis